MTAEAMLPVLLVVQGAIAGVDTLYNHEIIEQLPQKVSARAELRLHTAREAIWAVLLGGLAFFAWHGAAAVVIGALVVLELMVTAWDEVIENRTRILPHSERLLHVLLTLNLGAIIALLVPVLIEWHSQPTALIPHSYGLLSWPLAAFGAAALGWSIRDALAGRRLGTLAHA